MSEIILLIIAVIGALTCLAIVIGLAFIPLFIAKADLEEANRESRGEWKDGGSK